jgi:uncharacterized membrane protein
VFDPWFLGAVGAGLVVLLAMLAVLAFAYDALPADIPMRFDASGQPSQVAPRSDLLRLPMIGLLALLVDTALGVWLHPRDWLLARVLWIGGAVLEAVLLIAIVRLLQ